MPRSYSRSRRPLSDEDEYTNADNTYTSTHSDHNKSSLESIEQMLSRLFRSCNIHIPTFFSESLRPADSDESSVAGHSQSTATTCTEDSSKDSRKKSNHTSRRSKSVDCRRSRSMDYRKTSDNRGIDVRRPRSMSKATRSRQIDLRRHRSMSKARAHDADLQRHRSMSLSRAAHSSSILPLRENTEIAVVPDDDMSAISAHTLNEMHRQQLRKISAAVRENIALAQHRNGKENIFDEASHISQKSSGLESEFESIWKGRDNGSPKSNRSNFVDNCNSSVSGSIHREGRLIREKETRRRPFAIIEENNSLYVDEHRLSA